jgi:hypothetical protein
VSEALARKKRRTGIAVHMKPHLKLRDILVSPKDKSDTMDQAAVVYKISCKDCDSCYVGETTRPLKKRIKEHQKPPSPLYEHHRTTNHAIDYDNPKILDRETD